MATSAWDLNGFQLFFDQTNDPDTHWQWTSADKATLTLGNVGLSFAEAIDISIRTTSGDLVLAPAGGDVSVSGRLTNLGAALNLGAAATTGHALTTGDVLVGGKLEVNGVTYFDGVVTASPTAPTSDVAATDSMIAPQPPYPTTATTQTTGGDLVACPASGLEQLTGVTRAATTGDTITFVYTYNASGQWASATTTFTEGVDYDCDGAASDAACVLALKTAIDGHGTLGTVITTDCLDATCSDEALTLGVVPGTSCSLSVTPSDAVNTVVAHGTDGAFVVAGRIYNPTGPLNFGTSATTGHGLVGPDDTLVGGKLEVDGTVYFDGNVEVAGNVTMTGAKYLYVGQYGIQPQVAANTLLLATQTRSNAFATSDASLYSGAQSNVGDYASGAVKLYTGDTTTDGNTGNVWIYSGAAGAGIADAGDLVLAVNGAPGTGTTVATFDASAGGDLTIAGTIKTECVTAEAPAEPHVCDAAHAGVIVTVDDTNDTAYNQPCVCLNLDGTGYDWRQLNDVVGTACPTF